MDAATAYLMASLTGGNAPPAVQTDSTGYEAANALTLTQVTKYWPVLPGTPQAGTVYTLETEFTATAEDAAMAFGVNVGGTWTQFVPAAGAGAFANGSTLAGWLRLTVRVLTASTARFALGGAFGATGASTSPGNYVMAFAPLSQTLSLGAGDTVGLGVLWGASEAAQALATYGSTWVTLGGQG